MEQERLKQFSEKITGIKLQKMRCTLTGGKKRTFSQKLKTDMMVMIFFDNFFLRHTEIMGKKSSSQTGEFFYATFAK